MGKSADFSEGIKLIREAHEDAVAILEKWRELIDAPGEITLTIKDENGEPHDVTLPSIREAINRYLGGSFERITLTNGDSVVGIELDDNGQVVIRNVDSSVTNFITANLAASRIIPKGGSGISILGNTVLSGGVIQNANIQDLTAYTGQIYGAEFKGTTVISGGARITGNAAIRNATIKKLNSGLVKYRKQVLKWGVEAIVDEQLLTSVHNGLWVGDPAVLERAGIFPEPTWADCIHVPTAWPTSGLQLEVCLGDPYMGNIVITDSLATFSPCYAAMWPYKMYEAVEGGYRIRWLPLDDMEGRVTYYRTGNLATSPGSATVMMCDNLQVVSALTGMEAAVARRFVLNSYACRRFVAAMNTVLNPGVSVTDNLLF